MSDYVILIDENGQPYIAHSVFTKARDAISSAGRSAHKYIAKIGEGAKARYFYPQEELRAFYNQGKTAAGRAAETVRTAARNAKASARKAIGFDARDKRDDAARRYANERDSMPTTYTNSKSAQAHNASLERAGKLFTDANEEYKKTVLGRLENAGASAKNLAENAGRLASDASDRISKYAETTLDAIKNRKKKK